VNEEVEDLDYDFSFLGGVRGWFSCECLWTPCLWINLSSYGFFFPIWTHQIYLGGHLKSSSQWIA